MLVAQHFGARGLCRLYPRVMLTLSHSNTRQSALSIHRLEKLRRFQTQDLSEAFGLRWIRPGITVFEPADVAP